MQLVRLLVIAGFSLASALAQADVSAFLKTKIDSKTAKPGDQVTAETAFSTKTKSGVKLPKGTRLMGSVLDVQASQVTLHLDRAVTRDGREIPIQSMVHSISLPKALTVFQDVPNSFGGYGEPLNSPPDSHPAPLQGAVLGNSGREAPARGGHARPPRTWSGVPGVALTMDSNQNAVLSARGQDVVLESGIVLGLGLSTQ